LLGFTLLAGAATEPTPIGRLPRDADLPTRRERLRLLDRQIDDVRATITELEEALR